MKKTQLLSLFIHFEVVAGKSNIYSLSQLVINVFEQIQFFLGLGLLLAQLNFVYMLSNQIKSSGKLAFIKEGVAGLGPSKEVAGNICGKTWLHRTETIE